MKLSFFLPKFVTSLALAALCTAGAYAQEGAGGGGAAPFEGDKPRAMSSSPAIHIQSQEPAIALPATAPVVESPEVLSLPSYPYLLKHNQHPWPLRYAEPSSVNGLFLGLASAQDFRLMYPGAVAEAARRARETISRYINNSMGIAIQSRARQSETFLAWVERVDTQRANLAAGDQWAAYQFSRESLPMAADYLEKIQAQSQNNTGLFVREVQKAIQDMTVVMNAMQTYETRMIWYNLMVQLRDGAAMYQAKVQTSDANLLLMVEDYIRRNPAAPKPEGNPPPEGAAATAPVQPQLALPSNLAANQARRPALPVVEAKAEGSAWLGFAFIVVMALGFVGYFIRLRNKVKLKLPAGLK